MASVDQLIECLTVSSALRSCPIGILFWLQIGLEDRPSLNSRRGGSCITRFGACTAFTGGDYGQVAIATLYTGGSDGFVTSPPLRLLLPGGANQFPVGTFIRGGPVRFYGAREGRTNSFAENKTFGWISHAVGDWSGTT
jgi:hypothetical protein